MIRRVALLAAAGVLLLAGAAACGSSSGPATAKAGTCLATSATSPGSGGASAPGGKGDVRVPSQTVDCLDGSGAVRLDTLTEPAVINLWASYCIPCHVELPHMQAFAKAAGASVAVIGVDTADRKDAAQSVIDDLGLSYPMVFDPGQRIYNATAGRGLPATLFVAPGGDVRYVYESGTALDEAHLVALTNRYLGVTVHG